MRHAPTALALAATLAALPGCDKPLLFAELDVPSVRVTLPSQTFPASNTGNAADWCSAVQTNPPCVQLTLGYDIAGQIPVLNEQGVTYDLRLKDVGIVLASTDVLADLAGVERVTVEVLNDPLDPSAGSTVVATYVKPPGGGAPTSLSVTGDPNLDLAPYVQAGSLPARIEAVISAGTPEFTADVTAGFSLVVELDYGSLL